MNTALRIVVAALRHRAAADGPTGAIRLVERRRTGQTRRRAVDEGRRRSLLSRNARRLRTSPVQAAVSRCGWSARAARRDRRRRHREERRGHAAARGRDDRPARGQRRRRIPRHAPRRRNAPSSWSWRRRAHSGGNPAQLSGPQGQAHHVCAGEVSGGSEVHTVAWTRMATTSPTVLRLRGAAIRRR